MVIIEGQSLSGIALELNKYINKYLNLIRNDFLVNSKEEDVRNIIINDDNNDAKLNRDMIRNNSVQRDDVPSRIKIDRKHKKVAKSVVLLALIGVLIGTGFSFNNQVQYTDSEYAVMRVEALDGFDYNKKWVRDERYYNDMVDNIISFYSKLEQLPNENYKTLGLYNAYDGIVSIRNIDDALLEMESLFSLLRKKMVQEDVNEGFRIIVNADSDENYFFLDFVYDTLINAGFKEYDSRKFQDLLIKYKYSNYGNYYGVVGVKLTDNEKELIRDIMKRYQEYYKNVKIEIGNLMVSGDYSFIATYNGKGK